MVLVVLVVLVVPLVLVVLRGSCGSGGGYPVALPARSPAIDTACDLSRSISRWLERKNIRSVQDLEKRLSSVNSVQPKNIYSHPQTIEYHLKQAINV